MRARQPHNPRVTSRSELGPVDARQARWPLHDTAASRAIETAAAGSRGPHALMAAAGLSVARLALARWPHAQRIQVWAGPGNNGGDGLVAARHLLAAGRQVSVALLGDTARQPDDARWALAEAHAAGVCIRPGVPAGGSNADLHLDALLGIGASKAPIGDLAAAISALNAASQTGNAAVLAIDLPSGLSADTGALLGDAAVRADATLALLTIKPGCHTAQGRDHAGRVWFDSLGVATGLPTAWLCFATERAARAHDTHKGRYGDVAVVGGARGMTGAAWLAARAALAAGAGRVIASLLDEQAALGDAQRPELMTRRAYWESDADALAAATVVCGCGGGEAVALALPALLARTLRLVLDADALNAIASDADLRAALIARPANGQQTVLTPHPLEAARLLGLASAAVQGDRLHAAGELARRLHSTVVLKGSGTVIATTSAAPRIVATGNAALATAGTGDVLAGWLGGLWAQAPADAPIDLATAAVARHGAAADHWLAQGHRGPLLATDLITRLAHN